MQTRRTFLGAVSGAVVLGTAGCVEQSIPDEFNAAPASVPETTLEETGYSEQFIEEQPITRTVSLPTGGQQEVTVTNWASVYEKGLDLGGEDIQGAVFGVFTTPQISVAGQEFNPVAEWGPEEIATQAESRFSSTGSVEIQIENLEKTGTETTPIFDEEVEVTRFEGDIQVESLETVDAVVYAAMPIAHAGDFVMPAGGYPAAFDSAERETLFALMGAIEHGEDA